MDYLDIIIIQQERVWHTVARWCGKSMMQELINSECNGRNYCIVQLKAGSGVSLTSGRQMRDHENTPKVNHSKKHMTEHITLWYKEPVVWAAKVTALRQIDRRISTNRDEEKWRMISTNSPEGTPCSTILCPNASLTSPLEASTSSHSAKTNEGKQKGR